MNQFNPGNEFPTDLFKDLLWTTNLVFRASSLDHKLLFLSPAAREVYGREVAEFFANPNLWMEVIHPEDQPGAQQAMKEAHERGGFDLDYRIVRPDGEVIWVNDRGWLICDVRRPSYWCGILTDITPWKEAEAARDRLTLRLQSILDSVAEGIYGIDLDGRCTFANRAASRILGFAPEELLGKPIHHLIHYKHSDGRPYLEKDCPVQKTLLEGDSCLVDEEVFWSREGRPVPVQYASEPLREKGKTIGAVVAFTDITRRKSVENHLRREKNFSDITIGSLPGIFYLIDKQGLLLRWNDNLERVSGYSSDEISRMHPLDFIAPKDRPRAQRKFEEAFHSGQAAVEADFISRDGRKIPYYFTGKSFSLDGQECLVGMGMDITARKKAERQISLLNRQLEQRVQTRTAELQTANRELEAFSYSVSHDLRAPLRSIEGFSEALEDEFGDRLEDSGRAHLNRVRSATQRMGHLIESLLDLSRVSRTDLLRVQINLSQLAERIAEELKREEPSRTAEFIIQPGLLVKADGYLMRVVLENLLGNAWKFTRNRAVARIEFGCLQEPDGPVFYVKDNGAGFDMSYSEKLFTPFQRLHPADQYEGTGIGLATIQRIILRHGGRVWAEAAVDKGAAFFFTLPEEEEN
jgi:PAS domain S-box-containing protein